MMMPVIIGQQPTQQQTQQTVQQQPQPTELNLFGNLNNSQLGINIDFFSGQQPLSLSSTPTNGVISTSGGIDNNEPPAKRKRGRPPKSDSQVKQIDGNAVVMIDQQPATQQEFNPLISNQSYSYGYLQTKTMIEETINQIDCITGAVSQDIQKVRDSQMKSKYNVLPDMYSSLGSMLSTKLSAIKEINKTTTDAFNLDIKRAKELNIDQSKSGEQQVMDAYNAFISMPVGTGGFMPIPQNVLTSNSGIVRADLPGSNDDAGYNTYMQNMNNQQRSMMLEANPNIQTVVMYDFASGAKWFDVVDTATGQSIQGVDRPDPMFMEDTTIDMKNGVARNTNLGTNYKLIVINKDSTSLY